MTDTPDEPETEIVSTDDEPIMRPDFKPTLQDVIDVATAGAYYAMRFADRVQQDERYNISKKMTAKDLHMRLAAGRELIQALPKLLSVPKLPEAPVPSREQGVAEARGALVAMPAELAGVVREPAVREAIRKAWDADDSGERKDCCPECGRYGKHASGCGRDET